MGGSSHQFHSRMTQTGFHTLLMKCVRVRIDACSVTMKGVLIHACCCTVFSSGLQLNACSWDTHIHTCSHTLIHTYTGRRRVLSSCFAWHLGRPTVLCCCAADWNLLLLALIIRLLMLATGHRL